MNRKVLLLNLGLLALAGTLGWQLRQHWLETSAHERDVLLRAAQVPQVVPPPALVAPPSPTPGDYLDVAQRNLFSRDRNPNVVIEVKPEPPPPAKKPVPQLPYYHGQMAIGKPVVVLSLTGADQKGFYPGDMVGPFKLLAFDRELIKFEWEGETLERKLIELKPKEVLAQAPAAVAAPPPPANNVRSLSDSSATPAGATNPTFGADMGGDFRGCAPGDNSPAGTVLQGYRKVISQTMMGKSCHWELVK